MAIDLAPAGGVAAGRLRPWAHPHSHPGADTYAISNPDSYIFANTYAQSNAHSSDGTYSGTNPRTCHCVRA